MIGHPCLVSFFRIARFCAGACALAIGLASVGAGQTTYYVDGSVCPSAGTGTQLDPFCTIQSGIDAAQSGDLILVLPGSYTAFPNPVADFSGKDVTVRSTQGPALTTLRNGSPVVLFATSEGPGAVLEGFMITRAGTHGVEIIGASPTVRGNLITGIMAGSGGSGIRITAGSSALIEDNEIRDNFCVPSIGLGGGLYIANSSPTLLRNEIVHNIIYADYGNSDGAGIYIVASNVQLIGNLIADNHAVDEARNRGGGLFASESTLFMVGNTFADNLAADGDPLLPGLPGLGGAVCVSESQVTICDSIFWGNSASDGPEIAAFGGSVSIAYSDLESPLYGTSTMNPGAGNVSIDPLLAGYRVDMNSAVVDLGSPLATGSSFLDVDHEPRVLDGDFDGVPRLDMGWDEYDPTTVQVSGTATPGGALSFFTDAPNAWSYLLAYSTGLQQIVTPRYGYVLIDPTQLFIFGSGVAPGATPVNIPNGTGLLGIDIYVQALATEPVMNVGSFSRVITIRIQ